MALKQLSNFSPLIALAYGDLTGDDTTQKFKLGGEGFFIDDFGIRYFRYVKNVSGGAVAMGDVLRRVADVAIAAITSATTTSITKTAAGLTASAHIGKLLIDELENTPGSAPEGESGIIIANTTTKVTIDSGTAFSAAPTGGANVRIVSPGWHADNAGSSVVARDVIGVVIGTDGISNGNFGWVQFHGVCPLAAFTQAAVTTGDAIITGATAKFKTIGAGAANLVCGYSLATIGATNNTKFPVMLTLGTRAAATV